MATSRLTAVTALRFALLGVALAASPAGAAEVTPREILTGMAAGLGNENPAEFFEHFDRTSTAYSALRADVEALCLRAALTSAIEVISDSGDASRHVIEADWFLEIKDRNEAARYERRRERVRIEFAYQGSGRKKGWRVTSFSSVTLFASR